MAHRTSAAALHAARVVLHNYTLVPRPEEDLRGGKIPNLIADEIHLAVILDYATNIFELVQHRPELRYWQERMKVGIAEAPQIAGFLKKLTAAFDKMPRFAVGEKPIVTSLATPREFGGRPVIRPISKPALEASRFVFYYFSPLPKRGAFDDQLDRLRVATLVEVSMNLSRALSTEKTVRQCIEGLKREQLTPLEVQKILRMLGVLLEYLPNYFGDYREEELKLL